MFPGNNAFHELSHGVLLCKKNFQLSTVITDITNSNSDDGWILPSSTTGQDHYCVHFFYFIFLSSGQYQCKLVCNQIGVCDHRFICLCIDYLTRVID